MYKYAILNFPGHNRVYFEASKKLSIAELSILFKKDSFTCKNIKEEYIEDVFYTTFESDIKISDELNLEISKLSFVYCLFEVLDIEGSLFLKPISLNKSYQFLDDDVSQILKYSGKTNELFTRMMLNIGINSQKETNDIKILDPIAGKGTTLFEGLILGYDVYGVEIDEKVAHESNTFLKKYLETKRLKHTSKQERLSGNNKSFKAKVQSYEIGKDKEDIKNSSKTFKIVSGNSMYCDSYFKKNYFDCIIGDLPYGVQHGNISQSKTSGLTRNPKELLEMCLGSWNKVLKQGGSIVLGWNSYVLSYEDFKTILENKGFTVLCDEDYRSLEHMVDKSIKRDVIVAIKK